jgi:capsular polysaccharide biosynthesis protein
VAEESENRPDDAFEENEALRDELAEVLAEIWSERVDLLDRIRSYPESLERDKALVEQLGKQWDMVKAEADDLSRRDEKYGLEKAVEGVRIAYDWFKHLTTVSTGSVLLITVDQKQGDQQTYVTRSGEEIQPLPPGGAGLQTIILEMTHAIDSRPVAEEVIGRLGLRIDPAELLDKLTVEQVENTSFIVLSYEGTDPHKATQIVNTVGQVSSELIPERGAAGSQVTARVYGKAAVPDTPVSPHPLRNGLLTLVMGWGLIGLLVLIHRSS